jgi:hypothetical protein
MVAGGVSTSVGSTAQHLPLLATFPLKANDRFPISSYKPRRGRDGLTYERWRQDVRNLVSAFGLAEADLLEDGPPSFANFARSASVSSPLVGKRLSYTEYDADGDDAALRAAYDAALARWYAVNTAIYWHVLPSLMIDDAYYLTDRCALNDLCNGTVADGRGLLRWAAQWGDVSSPDEQKRLIRRLGESRLRTTGATRAILSSHAESLMQLWQLIGKNDSRDPVMLQDYWRELTATVDVTPLDSQLVATRTYTRKPAPGRTRARGQEWHAEILLLL